MKKTKQFSLLITLICLSCSGGGTSTVVLSDTNDETAQQVGDVMASIDEAGGSGGQIASLNHSIQKTFLRFSPKDIKENRWSDFIIQPAYAATDCSGASTFGTCDSLNNTLVRTFNGCKVGSATLQGTVTLVWDGTSTNCSLGTIGDSITRIPDFTVTGLRGATLAVSKTGTTGQNMEWLSGVGPSKTFSFTNDGINRKFTIGSKTLFDFTTKTTEAVTVTGTKRTNRVLNGGKLEVTNNKTDNVCTFVPTNVTWDTTSCNCPTSGTWEATCTDGKSTSIEITGCGTANVTAGEESSSVTFDRCEQL